MRDFLLFMVEQGVFDAKEVGFGRIVDSPAEAVEMVVRALAAVGARAPEAAQAEIATQDFSPLFTWQCTYENQARWRFRRRSHRLGLCRSHEAGDDSGGRRHVSRGPPERGQESLARRARSRTRSTPSCSRTPTSITPAGCRCSSGTALPGRFTRTAATIDLAEIIMKDCARIQSQDAERKTRKAAKNDLPPVEPLYEPEDVEPFRSLVRDRAVPEARARWPTASPPAGSRRDTCSARAASS